MANTTNAKTIEIPVDSIKETQCNEFIFGIHDSDVDRLAEEIKEHGFTGSIDVADLGDGTYQVFAGHQRLRAVKKLGWSTIPCTVAAPMSDAELLRKLLASNVLNRKISPLGYARAIDAYKKDVLSKEHYTGRAREACAKFFNISIGQTQRYEALLKTTPYVQDLCDRGIIPLYPLSEASPFTPEQQQMLETKIRGFLAQNKNISLSANLLAGMIWNIRKEESKEETKKKLDEAQGKLQETPAEEIVSAPAPDPVPSTEEAVPAQTEEAEEKAASPDSQSEEASQETPIISRTPDFSDYEGFLLTRSSSVAGTPISEASDDLDFADEDFSEPEMQTPPTAKTTDYPLIQACDALVDLSHNECDFASDADVLAAIERGEAALKKLKEEIKNSVKES